MENDLEETLGTVTMKDDDTGEDIEFAIIDTLDLDGQRYLLVVESELMDEEESEAIILKEIEEDDSNLTYCLVEDDDEFGRVADEFSSRSDEYEVELD